MAVQMRPDFTQCIQILCVDGAHDLIDDFVHAKSFVFVGLELGIERFEAVREAPEQHILSNQRVHILNMSHVRVLIAFLLPAAVYKLAEQHTIQIP